MLVTECVYIFHIAQTPSTQQTSPDRGAGGAFGWMQSIAIAVRQNVTSAEETRKC